MNGSADGSRALVQRIVRSTYFSKSVRLTEMFLYLSKRVLDDSAEEIHESEVGYKVFGRADHYDTVADNIVRVHASMLRKRLNEYFANEGRDEALVVDIPRGNYAPVFRKRAPHLAAPGVTEHIAAEEIYSDSPVPAVSPPPEPPTNHPQRRWMPWVPIALAVFFACLSAFLLFRDRGGEGARPFAIAPNGAVVRQFWSQIFHPADPAAIVLDDASADFYQEATTQRIELAQYFDRSYLRFVDQSAEAAKVDRDLVQAFMLRRQTSYANTALIWRLAQIAGSLRSNADLHFARDFSFHSVKSGNVILLGNRRSNPWIQPFESHLALRWKFDPALNIDYPVDTAAASAEQEKFRPSREAGKTHEGYAGISFLPNLSGTGNVLIISGSGGAAIGAALDFLTDERSMTELRSRLAAAKTPAFPYFEALLGVEKGMSLPRDTSIVICRSPSSIQQP